LDIHGGIGEGMGDAWDAATALRGHGGFFQNVLYSIRAMVYKEPMREDPGVSRPRRTPTEFTARMARIREL